MPNFSVKQFRKEKEKFKNDLMVKSTWGGGGGGRVELEGCYYKLNCPAVCKQEQIVCPEQLLCRSWKVVNGIASRSD